MPKQCLNGEIIVKIFDKEDNLKKVIHGNNTITTSGLKRISEMLTYGLKNNLSISETIGNYEYKTLHSIDFLGSNDDSLCVNIIEWKEKNKTTFDFSPLRDQGLINRNAMFKNIDGFYTTIEKDENLLDNFDYFYFPKQNGILEEDRQTSGWISDLGLNHVISQEHIFIQNIGIINGYNVKFNSISIKDENETILQEGVDYEILSLGDNENHPTISLVDYWLNKKLYISYSWFDVPNTPIIGFCFDHFTDAIQGISSSQNFISGWSWSLDQGKSRMNPFFPNVSGCPSGPSNIRMDQYGSYNKMQSNSWYSSWGGVKKTFFFNSLPWAVKNPTQLAWYSHTNNNYQRYFENFSLLGISAPKLGPHAIKLGTGENVSPNASDTDLNMPIESTKKAITNRRNDGESIISFEVKLDFNEAVSTIPFTEIGLYFPESDDVFFSDDEYWNETTENGGSGKNSDFISGNNKIVKLSKIKEKDCNMMFSHGKFDVPWTKSNDERISIIYKIRMIW